ncbi:MAG: sensor histidine kinase [Chthoniobacterales bacterium]
MLSQTEEIVRSEGTSKRVGITFEKNARDYHVDGDAARLQQVFWNIIKNGVKFTPSAGEVRVVTSNADGELIVRVTDTGMGIAPDALPRIFQAFEQGNLATGSFVLDYACTTVARCCDMRTKTRFILKNFLGLAVLALISIAPPALAQVASPEILTILRTGAGGVEDYTDSGYFRTLSWNTKTGRLVLRGEYHHGLYLAGDNYWWCQVGDVLSNGDIRFQIENSPDNSIELQPHGFVLPRAEWWAYRLKNVKGRSPFTRIQVRDAPGAETWHDVVPTEEFPVVAWLYGKRVFPHKSGSVYVAVSHSQLTALNGGPIPPDEEDKYENSVLVDLGRIVTNIGARD